MATTDYESIDYESCPTGLYEVLALVRRRIEEREPELASYVPDER
jgi:hypothetical protein